MQKAGTKRISQVVRNSLLGIGSPEAKHSKIIPLNAFVVMGREDFVFIQPALEELEPYKDTIPLTIMEECGHVCSLQKWREFNVIARKFFIEDRAATA